MQPSSTPRPRPRSAHAPLPLGSGRELGAGGGAVFERLHRNSYLEQRETWKTGGCGLRREGTSSQGWRAASGGRALQNPLGGGGLQTMLVVNPFDYVRKCGRPADTCSTQGVNPQKMLRESYCSAAVESHHLHTSVLGLRCVGAVTWAGLLHALTSARAGRPGAAPSSNIHRCYKSCGFVCVAT